MSATLVKTETETYPSVEPIVAARAVALPDLRRDSLRLFVGNAVYAASQWGLLAILARLGTTDMVGRWMLALAVTAPVMAFCMLHLRRVQATDAMNEFCLVDFLLMRLSGIFVAAIVIAIIGGTADYDREMIFVLLATTAVAIVDASADVIYGCLQRHERLDRIAYSMIVKSLLSLTLFALATYATGWFVYGILAIAVARFAIFFGYDLRGAAEIVNRDIVANKGRDFRLTWDGTRLVALLKLSLPLGLVMTLIVLSGSIPRYYLDRFVDESAVGIFGAIGYLTVVGTMFIGAIGESSNVRLAQDYAQGRKAEFLALTLRTASIAGGLGVLGILCATTIGGWTLNLLYGPDYAAHAELLTWIMLAGGVGYVASILGYAISAARYFRSQLPLFIIVAITTAVTCALWIPRFGLHGAAYALVATSATQLIGTLLIFVHALRHIPDAAADVSSSLVLN
ncbi:MAG: lipopolysaccharide biosynthesis protein [Pirellulales bacterium]